jgi:signal transduction histidine kinase
MPRNSIKNRLIATVVISQLLLAGGLVVTGVYYTHRRLVSALDTSLEGRGVSTAALVRYTEEKPPKLFFDADLARAGLDKEHPDLFEVTTTDGQVLARSPNWPGVIPGPEKAKKGHWNFKVGGVPYRALVLHHVPILDREGDEPPAFLEVVYATSTIAVNQQVQAAGLYIAVTSLVLLAITVVLSLWGIRRGLLPLQNLVDRAALVSAENWEFSPPKEAEQVAELEPLTQAMTTMVDRLRRSFMQQREFLGNAAHELKTPVAILKSTLQSLTQRPRSSEEYRMGLEESLEDLERLERLLQWMLRLARAEQWAHGALRRDLELVDLAGTCEEAIERLRGLAQERHATIRLVSEGHSMLRADPEDLQLVWVNLLENAVRYSPEGAAVEVSVRGNNGGPTQVVFEDHGAGIPAEDLPHIFDRFYRSDPSRTRSTGGFGLGLAIAKALVEAYGGTISAASTSGEGTRMTVELPVNES